MCYHKWGKWTEHQENWVRQWAGGEKIPYIQNTQKRYCLKCNKVQVEKVEAL